MDCTNCKCWIRPFEPPYGCYDCCTGKIIHYAKPHELVNFFEFDFILAEKIFEISINDNLIKLSDFKNQLTHEEFYRIDYNFKNIKEKGWKWIRTILKERIQADEKVPLYD